MSKLSEPTLVRWDEAMELIRSENNPITNQLLNHAMAIVLKAHQESDRTKLSNDFDLKFFLDVIKRFCADPNKLKQMLDGQDFDWEQKL